MLVKRLSLMAGLLGSMGVASTASAQIPPIAPHDETWGTVSHAVLGIGVASVLLTPRVFPNDGRLGRTGAGWHLSLWAPAATILSATLFIQEGVAPFVGIPRPACTRDQTMIGIPDSGCESYGSPSVHAFGSWGSLGTGVAIFVVDTAVFGRGSVEPLPLVGQVVIPFVSAMMVSTARGVNTGGTDEFGTAIVPYESAGQVAAGAIAGFLTGMTLGLGYALLRPPACPGGSMICW